MRFHMPSGGTSAGQCELAKSLIRLLKLYLKERDSAVARREIAHSIRTMAEQLEAMPDAGSIPNPPPRCL